MRFEFETDDCSHCPCLRNNKYGEFTCFFDDGRILDTYNLNEIDDYCPLLPDRTENKE